MVNLASPKTFEIVEYILEKKQFTQYKAHKDLRGVSFGLINRVSNWLLNRGFIVRKKSEYVLSDPAGIISAISIYRDMKSLKLFEANTSLSKEELIKLIPKKAVFCLDSTLSLWTNYYKSNRVCIYADKKEAESLKNKLLFKAGNKAVICIYEEKPSVKLKKKINARFYTDEIRTVIDMACDDKAFAAETLYKEIWGGKFG